MQSDFQDLFCPIFINSGINSPRVVVLQPYLDLQPSRPQKAQLRFGRLLLTEPCRNATTHWLPLNWWNIVTEFLRMGLPTDNRLENLWVVLQRLSISKIHCTKNIKFEYYNIPVRVLSSVKRLHIIIIIVLIVALDFSCITPPVS
jgi:hypothetical protein